MLKYVAAYGATAIAFLGFDMIWLGFIAKDVYREKIGHLMAAQPSIPAALMFYALYFVGIMIFGVAPGLRDGSWKSAMIFGALFGFFAYATYDFTNWATLKDWPAILVPIDLAWGTFITAVGSVVGYFAARWVAS